MPKQAQTVAIGLCARGCCPTAPRRTSTPTKRFDQQRDDHVGANTERQAICNSRITSTEWPLFLRLRRQRFRWW